VGVFLFGLFFVAWYTKRFTRSVSDFLAANRVAGRYLLTMSEGMAGLGATAFIANFEKFYNAGFPAGWWGILLTPLGLIVALSGWVIYRYRETRAMTMSQFFEMRYSRTFRLFSGFLCAVSGIINYGIFPAIFGRFIVFFCGLPEEFSLLGMTMQTYWLVMLVELTIAVTFTLWGGMVAVMITDFLQAQFTNIVFLMVMVVLFYKFGWTDIIETLKTAPEEGHSMLNPFRQSKVEDFNMWFFFIMGFKTFYSCMAWQGMQGYNCSAKSPHEAKMARVLGEWRNGVTYLMIMIMPICAYVLMHNPDYAAQKEVVDSTLAGISEAQIQKQMTVPIALATIFPVGLMGLFCTAVFFAAISTDDTYLHSWGSIVIQDVFMPVRQFFRRWQGLPETPLTPKSHLILLRLGIIGVAVFAFFFSIFFDLRDHLFMFFFLTGTIYLGGAGACIIGGLYTRWGTVMGAYWAMAVGAIIGTIGIIVHNFWMQIGANVALSNFALHSIMLSVFYTASAALVIMGAIYLFFGDKARMSTRRAMMSFLMAGIVFALAMVFKFNWFTPVGLVLYAACIPPLAMCLYHLFSNSEEDSMTKSLYAFLVGGGLLLTAVVFHKALGPIMGSWLTEERFYDKFPLRAHWLAMIAYIAASAAYTVVSLITMKEPFNLEKMLHRGEYKIQDEEETQRFAKPNRGLRALGITDEFTRGDRLIFFFKIGWVMMWFFVFLIGTLGALVAQKFYDTNIPDSWWAMWWRIQVTITVCVGVITVIWFLWGGFKDMAEMFRRLRTVSRDLQDDGTVYETQEAPIEEPMSAEEGMTPDEKKVPPEPRNTNFE